MNLVDYAIERYLDHRRYVAAIRHDGVITNEYDPYFDKARDAIRAVNIEFDLGITIPAFTLRRSCDLRVHGRTLTLALPVFDDDESMDGWTRVDDEWTLTVEPPVDPKVAMRRLLSRMRHCIRPCGGDRWLVRRTAQDWMPKTTDAVVQFVLPLLTQRRPFSGGLRTDPIDAEASAELLRQLNDDLATVEG